MLDVMNRMIEEQVRFKMKYPDYPLSLEKLDTETCIVSDLFFNHSVHNI